jgi:hypothetical protein
VDDIKIVKGWWKKRAAADDSIIVKMMDENSSLNKMKTKTLFTSLFILMIFIRVLCF